jgi:hypothetical protein
LRRYAGVILALLVLWQVGGTLKVWPFHLTYFNEIAGGPQNGWRYLADSNVDWGQGLKALRAYLNTRGDPQIRLSHFVFFIHPELYGIHATPLPPHPAAPAVLPSRFNPEPGTYIISASTLRGLQVADSETYNWFWHREPDDIVANAFLVYEVPKPTPAPEWVGQCTVPVTPLTAELAAERFGESALRHIAFDCTQSWLYPQQGETAGWYVLHQAVNFTPFVSEALAEARLSFEQRSPGETPPLSVYAWQTKATGAADATRAADATEALKSLTVKSAITSSIWGAPVEWPPTHATTAGVALTPPITLTGPLAFQGYTILHNGESTDTKSPLALLTYWHVTQTPTRPFSLLAHQLRGDGQTIAVGDALGISWHTLQPGDLLIQRHSFPSSAQGAPEPPKAIWLRIGGYWLDTMERWSVLENGQNVGDSLIVHHTYD